MVESLSHFFSLVPAPTRLERQALALSCGDGCLRALISRAESVDEFYFYVRPHGANPSQEYLNELSGLYAENMAILKRLKSLHATSTVTESCMKQEVENEISNADSPNNE